MQKTKRPPRHFTVLSLSLHERSLRSALALAHPSKNKTRVVAALLEKEAKLKQSNELRAS